jgi:radical SAM protein with 4Fe4S-binding SPASM domain
MSWLTRKAIPIYSRLNLVLEKFPFQINYIIFKIFLKKKYPTSLSVELTNSCNYKCTLCPTTNLMTRKRGMMDLSTYEKLVRQVKGKTKKFYFNYAGEPTLNPQFINMIKIAKKNDIWVQLSTNGSFNNPKEIVKTNVDEILFAMDGISKKTQEYYRKRSNFNVVLKNLKDLCKYKKMVGSKTKIIWQFIIMKSNEHEIPDAIKLAKQIGVDELHLKPISLFEGFLNKSKEELYNEFVPINKKYSRYDFKIDRTVNKPVFCPALHAPLVLFNGDVTICCYDYDGKYALGNIKKSNIIKLFNNKTYTNIKKNIISKNLKICKECTIGIGGSFIFKFN